MDEIENQPSPAKKLRQNSTPLSPLSSSNARVASPVKATACIRSLQFEEDKVKALPYKDNIGK